MEIAINKSSIFAAWMLTFIAANSLGAEVPYKKILENISSKRNELKIQNAKLRAPKKLKASVGLFRSLLTTQVIPAWYGTKWDFNGYTAEPLKGKIACGYFVSTVLRDLGFRLNRYRLAQKHSFEMIDFFGTYSHMFQKRLDLESFVRVEESQIFLLALDNHVGFIVKEGKEIFFIHSSYLPPHQVVKESFQSSEALKLSQKFKVISLDSNEDLLEKWQKEVPLK